MGRRRRQGHRCHRFPTNGAFGGGSRPPGGYWLAGRGRGGGGPGLVSQVGQHEDVSPSPVGQHVCGPSFHTGSAEQRDGSARRSARALLYRASIEPGSDRCASAVSVFQPSGWGSHGLAPSAVNPNGGCSPDHGSGTRQPSRPLSVCLDRCQKGSCRSSSGMSSTRRRSHPRPETTGQRDLRLAS